MLSVCFLSWWKLIFGSSCHDNWWANSPLFLCYSLCIWQSLVDIALRSTAAASDPSHEDLTCCVVSQLPGSSQIVLYLWLSYVIYLLKQERSSLLKKLTTLKDLGCAYSSDKFAAANVDQPMTLSITGLETFCLGYKVLFVFSLNISHCVYLVIVEWYTWSANRYCRSRGHYLL